MNLTKFFFLSCSLKVAEKEACETVTNSRDSFLKKSKDMYMSGPDFAALDVDYDGKVNHLHRLMMAVQRDEALYDQMLIESGFFF